MITTGRDILPYDEMITVMVKKISYSDGFTEVLR